MPAHQKKRPNPSLTEPPRPSQLSSQLRSLTPEQIHLLRFNGTFPPTSLPLPLAIHKITHTLLAIQAVEPDNVLLALWNRLPTPRPTRAQLIPLALEGPAPAGLVRTWAQRAVCHVVTEEDWPVLSGALLELVEKKCGGSSSETAIEKLEQGESISTADCHFSRELVTLSGKGFRVLGEGKNARRVCISPNKSAWRPVEEFEGLCKAAERYFHAYGPAREGDFRFWMGLSAKKSKPAVQRVVEEGKVVRIGDMLIGRGRMGEVVRPLERRVMLLGNYDATLMAHRDKSWIVDEDEKLNVWTQRQVERSVVVDGRIWGTWWREGQGVNLCFFRAAEVDQELVDETYECAEGVLRGFYESEGEVVMWKYAWCGNPRCWRRRRIRPTKRQRIE